MHVEGTCSSGERGEDAGKDNFWLHVHTLQNH